MTRTRNGWRAANQFPAADESSDTSSSSSSSSSTGSSRPIEQERRGVICCCLPKRQPASPQKQAKSKYIYEDARSGASSRDDGLGAMGAAIAAAGVNWGRLPPASPDHSFDLRRFMRAGDIINLLGGNMWGHCVLLLATPRAVEVPVLYEMDDPEEQKRKNSTPMPKPLSVLGTKVPVFLCRILQSASNMASISVGPTALVVHPVNGSICVVKEMWGGVQICAGRKSAVTAQILLSPLSNEDMDFPNFNLAVEETYRAPADTKWSFKTAVRSYLRNAALYRSKYTSDGGLLKLARKLGERWTKRPICSTVPVRVWQKYLLKLSYRDQGEIPAFGSDDSAEIRWAESVLRAVPVKDDRVLPAELVRILLEAPDAWQEVDFERGPPEHRLHDLDRIPADATLFSSPALPNSYRPWLPSGLVNADGFTVALDPRTKFLLYCGQQFDKPQQRETRVAGGDVVKVDWDGRCGPAQGPQCSACRSLQDRLPSIPDAPVVPRFPVPRPVQFVRPPPAAAVCYVQTTQFRPMVQQLPVQQINRVY